MSTAIDRIIEGILEVEGGYVDHKHDRGGKTNWGITEAVARENGYKGDMRDMPRSFAEAVYRKRYITAPGFDRIMEVSPLIGEELVDTGVNMGPHRAAEFLQRWLNGFNTGDWEELFVDGAAGPATRRALAAYLRKRGKDGEGVLYTALNCTQGSRYLELTESSKKQRSFLYGWMRARVQL